MLKSNSLTDFTNLFSPENLMLECNSVEDNLNNQQSRRSKSMKSKTILLQRLKKDN